MLMEPLVETLADEGNSLAAYLVGQLAEARTAMQSENVAAGAFLAEASRG